MLTTWLLALAPIAFVLVLMVGLRWGAAQAGPVGWIVALAVAAAAFGSGPELLALAQLKALLLSLFVLYIIWMALLFYHVVDEAGVIKTLGAGLPALTSDRAMQTLILAWAFGSFLQGITGFGVPTAVIAPMLVGVGFAAGPAVVAAGLGHAWSVTFGSLASSFLALMAASGRTGQELALESALLLGLACFGCGAVVLLASGGARALVRHLGAILVLGGVMSTVQYGVAAAGVYSLAAASGGLAGLGAAVLWARLRRDDQRRHSAQQTPMPIPLALVPYGLLILVVGGAHLVPSVGNVLDTVVLRVDFPALQTTFGYTTPAGPGRTISIFGHAGALLVYTSLLSYLIFRFTGHLRSEAASAIVTATLRRSVNPTFGILSMVAMAVTMEHAGMTQHLAQGLGKVAGAAYPFVAPFIGALGAFMTGSNTNSNVVFGELQDTAAQILGYSPTIILAAQTTGAALGAAFAPAKVIVGCSTVGLGGQEGGVLRATLAYGLALITVVGVATWTWLSF